MPSPEQWTHPEPGVGPAATAAKPTAEQVIAGLRATSEGGAELVQLLTPEGERVAEPRVGPLRRRRRRRRRCRASTATWCSCAASTARPTPCSARASSASGCRCSARRPRRSAPAARCSPQDMAFPSYREHGVAWCRGVDPTELLGIFRGTDHGSWDPIAHRFHLYTIVIGNQVPQRHRLRDGPAVRGQGRRRADGEATIVLLRRRRHQPGRRARGLRLGRGLRRAASSSSARTTSGPSPSPPSARPACRSTSAPAATASPASASTATTCSPASPSPAGRSRSAAPATARC